MSGCSKSGKDNAPAAPVTPVNYSSVTVNGKVYTSTALASGLSLTFTDSLTVQKINFFIDDWYVNHTRTVTTGAYTLSTGYYQGGLFYASYASYTIDSVHGGSKKYVTDATHTGYLSITVVNDSATGAFDFTAVDSAGETITISNGKLNEIGLR